MIREQSGNDRPRIVVRFTRAGRGWDASSLVSGGDRIGAGPWNELLETFPDLRLTPVFTAEQGEIEALQKRALETDPTYVAADLGAFFYVDSPPETDLIILVKTLLEWNSVEEAYIDQAGPDPVVNASNDPRSPSQGYLDPSPDGIDAEYAWTFAGGDGAGQRVIDLEQGWTLNHEDITAHGATLLHGTLADSSRGHGTSVLGEIVAVDNTVGCVGIVPTRRRRATSSPTSAALVRMRSSPPWDPWCSAIPCCSRRRSG